MPLGGGGTLRDSLVPLRLVPRPSSPSFLGGGRGYSEGLVPLGPPRAASLAPRSAQERVAQRREARSVGRALLRLSREPSPETLSLSSSLSLDQRESLWSKGPCCLVAPGPERRAGANRGPSGRAPPGSRPAPHRGEHVVGPARPPVHLSAPSVRQLSGRAAVSPGGGRLSPRQCMAGLEHGGDWEDLEARSGRTWRGAGGGGPGWGTGVAPDCRRSSADTADCTTRPVPSRLEERAGLPSARRVSPTRGGVRRGSPQACAARERRGFRGSARAAR